MLDAVVVARAPILSGTRPFTRTAARVVDRGDTRTAARVADRNVTRTAARVTDRTDTSADDRPDVRAICCTDAPADVFDEFPATLRANSSLQIPSVSPLTPFLLPLSELTPPPPNSPFFVPPQFVKTHLSQLTSPSLLPPRRCYEVGGIKHLSRNCQSRSCQQSEQPAESKPESTDAVSSAGTRVSQLFANAAINGMLIRDALVDTGSVYSILNSAFYDRLLSRLAINSFEDSPPEIVGVGGASAEVVEYVEVPLLTAGLEVTQSLLVVSELPFAMLIGMDVLRPHAASISMCESTSLLLRNSLCFVCLERRAETKRESRKAPAVVCAVDAN